MDDLEWPPKTASAWVGLVYACMLLTYTSQSLLLHLEHEMAYHRQILNWCVKRLISSQNVCLSQTSGDRLICSVMRHLVPVTAMMLLHAPSECSDRSLSYLDVWPMSTDFSTGLLPSCPSVRACKASTTFLWSGVRRAAHSMLATLTQWVTDDHSLLSTCMQLPGALLSEFLSLPRPVPKRRSRLSASTQYSVRKLTYTALGQRNWRICLYSDHHAGARMTYSCPDMTHDRRRNTTTNSCSECSQSLCTLDTCTVTVLVTWLIPLAAATLVDPRSPRPACWVSRMT